MKKVTRTPPSGNGQKPTIPPYRELMLNALLASLKSLPGQWDWSAGWLPLGREGRRHLAENGINSQDLRAAIDDGVRAGLIEKKILGGYPSIALASKVVK